MIKQRLTLALAISAAMTGLTTLSSYAADLDVVAAEVKQVAQQVQFDGTVEAVNRAVVAAQTSGRILELPFDYGDVVEQGAVIARLTQSEQRAGLDAAKAQLNEAQTAYDEAVRQFDRLTSLFERKLVAIAPVDTARQQRDAARARLDAAKAMVNDARARFQYTEVVAPYTGIVVNKLVSEGEAVQPGTPLMEGIALDQLRVRVQIPQANVTEARNSQSIHIQIGDELVKPVATKLIPTADQLSHTFNLLLDLPAAQFAANPLPGQLVRVLFATDNETLLVLPESAIAKRGEIKGVYVQKDDGAINFRYIRTGANTVAGVEIISGLAEGETVLADPTAAAVAYKGVQGGN